MTKMTSKVLASSLVILTALGLAGCTNSATAPSTKTTTAAEKVSKPTNEKASTTSTTSKKAGEIHATSTSTSAKSTSNTKTAISSSQAAKSISSSSQASTQQLSSSTPTNNDKQVLTSFVKTSGIQQDGNHYYVAKNNQNDNYQIEVRNNQGGDPNIAHLTGTYQYDPTTNQIHQMNPVTGNYGD